MRKLLYILAAVLLIPALAKPVRAQEQTLAIAVGSTSQGQDTTSLTNYTGTAWDQLTNLPVTTQCTPYSCYAENTAMTCTSGVGTCVGPRIGGNTTTGIAIPLNAVIDGLQFSFLDFQNTDNGGGSQSGTIDTSSVSLCLGGSWSWSGNQATCSTGGIIVTKTGLGTAWPGVTGAETETYGGATDLWGDFSTTITPALINAGVGAFIVPNLNGMGTGASIHAATNTWTLTVYYHVAQPYSTVVGPA